MENPNQQKSEEPAALLCDIPCGDNVCIPRSRYDKLIRSEMELEILFHAYQIMNAFSVMNAFSMEPVLDAIFNPYFKHKCAADADNKAGARDAE